MKRLFPSLIALLAIAIPAHSQITVTNSVFPVVGDTLRYVFGNQPDAIYAVYTPPGGDQNWDLSLLQADSTWEAIYVDPSMGMGSAFFPDATLMYIPAGAPAGQEDYLNVSDTEVNYIGSYGADPLQLGASWTMFPYPWIGMDWAPANFFDIRVETSASLTYFLPDEMPPGWSAMFPNVDSLRIRTTTTLISSVDAWGTLTIPGGSYAVLRNKRTMYHEQRLDGKFNPLGWLDATDQALALWGFSPDVLGLDTTYAFHFINDISKETIAIATYVEDDFGNDSTYVSNVRYKVADFSTAAGSPVSTNAMVRVFPNPSSDRIWINAPGLRPGTFDLVVLDALGREVMRQRDMLSGNSLQLDLDIAAMEPGSYRGVIILSGGDRSEFRFVKQ